MAIYNPGKYYLVSYDEENETCFVSPFDVEKVEQTYGDVFTFRSDQMFNPNNYCAPTVTKVEGKLYGTMNILKSKDLKDVSYEELMHIIKE